jgi:hypothetical protein
MKKGNVPENLENQRTSQGPFVPGTDLVTTLPKTGCPISIHIRKQTCSSAEAENYFKNKLGG